MKRLCICMSVLSVAAFAATARANLLDDGSFDLAANGGQTSNSAWTLTLDSGGTGAVFSNSGWASRDFIDNSDPEPDVGVGVCAVSGSGTYSSCFIPHLAKPLSLESDRTDSGRRDWCDQWPLQQPANGG